MLQVHLSWAPTQREADDIAFDQWRSNLFDSSLAWNMEMPEQFDAAAKYVQPDDVRDGVFVSADTGRHLAHLAELASLGPAGIYLHHVGQTQEAFIDTFGAKVLPELAVAS